MQNLTTLASAGDTIAGVENENVLCDPDHAHFRGAFIRSFVIVGRSPVFSGPQR